MSNLKLALVIASTVLVAALALGAGLYLARSRSSAASQEGFVHVHEDGTEHIHGADGHGEGEPPVPVMGIVEQVEGSKIIVKEPMTGLQLSFDLTSDAKIHRQVNAQMTDLQPGTTMTALGPENGGVIQADIVLLGEDAVMGARLPLEEMNPGAVEVMPGAPGDTAGGETVEVVPVAPGDTAGGGTVEVVPVAPGASPGDVVPAFPSPEGEATILLPDPVVGTVERVDGNTIVLKRADGTTANVQIAPNAMFQKYVDAQAADVTVGQSIMALPPLDGEAMRVRILLTAKTT